VTRTRWKAVATVLGFALAALTAGACGAGDDDTTTTVQPPAVSAATADRLAKLSNRVAENLDAGLTCDAAHAADDLSAAVEESDLPANLRPGVETVATDLVNQVNCPPPPPPPEPEKKPKEEEGDQRGNGDDRGNGDEDGGGDEDRGDGNGRGGDGKSGGGDSDDGGVVPPGKAKLKGKDG
jgi:hypothetical protein